MYFSSRKAERELGYRLGAIRTSRSRGHRLVQEPWLLLDRQRERPRARELRADQVLGKGAMRGSTCPRSARSRSRSTRCGRTRTSSSTRRLAADELVLDGQAARRAARQGVRVPRLAARDAPASGPARVVASTNNFPTGAGLASSASGFAALVTAAAAALDLELSAARAQHRRTSRLRVCGALRFLAASSRCTRARPPDGSGQLRRAAAGRARVAARGRDCHDGERARRKSTRVAA